MRCQLSGVVIGGVDLIYILIEVCKVPLQVCGEQVLSLGDIFVVPQINVLLRLILKADIW